VLPDTYETANLVIAARPLVQKTVQTIEREVIWAKHLSGFSLTHAKARFENIDGLFCGIH
jgi:hypothetical protein